MIWWLISKVGLMEFAICWMWRWKESNPTPHSYPEAWNWLFLVWEALGGAGLGTEKCAAWFGPCNPGDLAQPVCEKASATIRKTRGRMALALAEHVGETASSLRWGWPAVARGQAHLRHLHQCQLPQASAPRDPLHWGLEARGGSVCRSISMWLWRNFFIILFVMEICD